jgi:hypothetical protein
MAHVIGTVYRPFKHYPKNDPLFRAVAIYLHKVKSHKLVGFPGSIGDGSERPDIGIEFSWQQARYLINGVSPLECRTAEAFYLPAAELNAHHAMPATRSPLPASDDFQVDYQPRRIAITTAGDFEQPTAFQKALPHAPF